MRHQCKRHHLSKASDQKRALMRSLATELFLNGEITTTMARAKALKPYAENIITFAKKGDLASRRQALRFVFDKETSKFINPATGEVKETLDKDEKLPKQSVLRQLFVVIGKKYASRNGGYTRIQRLVPRRGDASEMALIQLV
ncbi:MAG: 50S ribosomal protein L17 [Candidatus Gastranaerophilales bacterium]|nr:50S ribosomal protein L17 [Candidatus Gastranaerophilales bacterium]